MHTLVDNLPRRRTHRIKRASGAQLLLFSHRPYLVPRHILFRLCDLSALPSVNSVRSPSFFFFSPKPLRLCASALSFSYPSSSLSKSRPQIVPGSKYPPDQIVASPHSSTEMHLPHFPKPQTRSRPQSVERAPTIPRALPNPNAVVAAQNQPPQRPPSTAPIQFPSPEPQRSNAAPLCTGARSFPATPPTPPVKSQTSPPQILPRPSRPNKSPAARPIHRGRRLQSSPRPSSPSLAVPVPPTPPPCLQTIRPHVAVYRLPSKSAAPSAPASNSESRELAAAPRPRLKSRTKPSASPSATGATEKSPARS